MGGIRFVYWNRRAIWFVYVISQVRSVPTATIAMGDIQAVLCSAVQDLFSDENYEQSFAFYRFWFDIAQTYFKVPSNQIFDALWSERERGCLEDYTPSRQDNSVFGGDRGGVGRGRGGFYSHLSPSRPSPLPPPPLKLIHPNAHLILRISSDVESDNILATHNSGLQNRLCAKILTKFFEGNLTVVWQNRTGSEDWVARYRVPQLFYAHANLIAHWANLGYVQEAAIHSHILQSLISHPKLHDHQADALIILFKLAGATFEAHVDPSVVDRCFELLRGHYSRDSERGKLVQVRALCVVTGNDRLM